MPKHLTASAMILLLFSPTLAAAQESGFFAGLDLSAGAAFGSSTTRDGGAPWAGGGIVDKVSFGALSGVGVRAGYRFDPTFSTFGSLDFLRGDVRWRASYPLFGVQSTFEGAAVSTVIMGNLAGDFALGETTVLRARAGFGLSLNTLADIVETEMATGTFVADVAQRMRVSPAARIGVGIAQQIAPGAEFGIETGLTYVGSFETGDSRTGNLGATAIKPYRIDDVWAANVSASLRVEF